MIKLFSVFILMFSFSVLAKEPSNQQLQASKFEVCLYVTEAAEQAIVQKALGETFPPITREKLSPLAKLGLEGYVTAWISTLPTKETLAIVYEQCIKSKVWKEMSQ